MGLPEQFAEELAVIKKAPYTFIIGFVVLAALIGAGEYGLFKESLARKDSVIKDKDDFITTLKDKLATKTPPQTAAPDDPGRTGSAAVNGGVGNTANTGSHNKFGQDTPQKQKQK